jgi:UDP-N-acetylglucosamine pyrophosphorylase
MDKVSKYLEKRPILKKIVRNLSEEEKFSIFSVIELDQGDRVFKGLEENENSKQLLKKMASDLKEVESFYKAIGGIKGYHKKIKELVGKEDVKGAKVKFLPPSFVNIFKRNKEVEEYINCGVKNLKFLGAIFPMGGSGDRLGLFCERKKRPLPAAKLKFFGKTLLEFLILDLKAKEYFYYKKYGERVVIPTVVMTSDDKNNCEMIYELFERYEWFGRGKNNFFFVKQPLMPVVTENGDFVMKGNLSLLLKPSGHGALWKVMKKQGGFEYFYKRGVKKAFIRQINNPLASIDYGFLAFIGCGFKRNMDFGFSTCPRLENSAEGMNVLKEIREEIGEKDIKKYLVSNVEYSDFKREGILEEKGKNFSKFPANTNILFFDLKRVECAVEKNPFPGMIVNMKMEIAEKNKSLKAGRLELMMQNISDEMFCLNKERLKTFLVYNERIKTISVTKNLYVEGKKILETPVSCFLDFLKNYFDLLVNYCKVKLPKVDFEKIDIENFLKKPPFVCYITPFLGPMFLEVSRKISLGEIKFGSEIFLEAFKIFIRNIFLDGSFLVFERDINKKSFLGKSGCVLENVKVVNRGVDYLKKNVFWKGEIQRKEAFHLVLNENSFFEARDIVFKGNYFIEVEKNVKMKAYMDGGEVKFEKIKVL